MRWLLTLVLLLLLLGGPVMAQATEYYISPTGSDGADGLTTTTPWRSFAKAFGGTGMAGSPVGCGHTLNLANGVYGDGTSTGQISISGKLCTAGSPLTIRTVNQRQARIHDDGNGIAVRVSNSSYITFDGLVVSSIDNPAQTCATCGIPYYVTSSNHINFKNGLGRNPNRYANVQVFFLVASQDCLLEDTEAYNFHRHAYEFFQGQRNVARRPYANARTGLPGIIPCCPGTVGKADSLMSMYPCKDCIVENAIAEGTTAGMYLGENNATGSGGIAMSGSKWLGSICINCSRGTGIQSVGRNGTLAINSPTSLTFQDLVIYNHSTASPALLNDDGHSNVYNRLTLLSNGGTTGYDAGDASFGTLPNSFTITNSIVKGFSGTGFVAAPTSAFSVLSGSNNFSNGNGTAFSPSAATWGSDNVTTDPQLGTCLAWAPDGSNAATAGVGARILYRYVNGILQDGTGGTTLIKLWDPTTGEFPHGAVDLDGTNAVVGDSLSDVHERLHINTGGCDFPSGYATTAPTNPASLVSSQGTTSPSHVRTVTASKEALTAGVALYDSGANVGTVTGITSSCGSEALTQLGTAVTSPAYRRVYLYGRLNPTAGASCTISVTTSGAVSSSVLLSNEYDNVAAFGTAAAASGLSSTPSVTAVVTADAGNTILDMLVTKCGLSAGACTTSISAGADQTLLVEQGHLTISDVRGAMSEQASTASAVMSYVTGIDSYWGTVAVPLCAVSCDALTQVISQVAGQVDNAFLVSGAVQHLGAVNAANVNIDVGTSFAVPLQTDCTVAACVSAGRKLYFSRNSGAYVPMTDTVTTGISFFGATSDPAVVSGAISANLSGVLTNVPGTTIHSASVVPSVAMTQDDSLVNRWVVKLDPAATEGDTYEFREYTDAGVALDAYGATADAKITVTGTSPVITAPTNLRLSGTTSTETTLIWTASTYAFLGGYNVYQSTESGVYSAVPTATLTPATGAATNSPITKWTAKTLVGDTYYWVVKAFDQDGNLSAVSSEVSSVQAGFDPTSAGARTASGTRTTTDVRSLR